jgi:hypothetical protein
MIQIQVSTVKMSPGCNFFKICKFPIYTYNLIPLFFSLLSLCFHYKDIDNGGKMSLWEEIHRKYYPERYGFEPFGDPLEDHPEGKAAHERRQERIMFAKHKRQQEAIKASASGNSEKVEL